MEKISPIYLQYCTMHRHYKTNSTENRITENKLFGSQHWPKDCESEVVNDKRNAGGLDIRVG